MESPKLRRKQDEQAKLKFKECLTGEDWSDVTGEDWSDVTGECESQNMSHAYQLFLSKYQNLYNRCFPLATIGSESRTKKTGMDDPRSSKIVEQFL